MSDLDLLVAVATAIHLVDCEAEPCEWEFYPQAEEAQYAATAIATIERLKANQLPDGGMWDVEMGHMHDGDFCTAQGGEILRPTHQRRVLYGPVEPIAEVSE